jgi:hypothetical protein
MVPTPPFPATAWRWSAGGTHTRTQTDRMWQEMNQFNAVKWNIISNGIIMITPSWRINSIR